MKELLMGCGSRTEKDIYIDNPEFENVTRLDYNADHKPDVVWDLSVHPLPFEDEAFDLIFHPVSNCYIEDVVHVWKECYRILKKGGILLAGLDNGINFIFILKIIHFPFMKTFFLIAEIDNCHIKILLPIIYL